MLFLKLLAPLVMLVIAVLRFTLQHRWRDKRTRKYKRTTTGLVCLFVVGFLITVSIVVQDHRTSEQQDRRLIELLDAAETQAEEAEKREVEAKQERAMLQTEIGSLQSRLDPFVKIAQARYPEVNSDSALEQLSNEIAALRDKTTRLESATQQIASRDFFQPLDPLLRASVVEQLKSTRLKYQSINPSIYAWCDGGNRNRHLVAEELVQIFRDSGFVTDDPICGTTHSGNVLPPVGMTLNPQDTDLADDLASGLLSFLKVQQFVGKTTDERKRGTLTIEIHGDPLFWPDGSVTFK